MGALALAEPASSGSPQPSRKDISYSNQVIVWEGPTGEKRIIIAALRRTHYSLVLLLRPPLAHSRARLLFCSLFGALGGCFSAFRRHSSTFSERFLRGGLEVFVLAPEDVPGPPVLPEYGLGGGVVDIEYFGCAVDGKAVLHYHLDQHFAHLDSANGYIKWNGVVLGLARSQDA